MISSDSQEGRASTLLSAIDFGVSDSVSVLVFARQDANGNVVFDPATNEELRAGRLRLVSSPRRPSYYGRITVSEE